jgi:hypothetical protein
MPVNLRMGPQFGLQRGDAIPVCAKKWGCHDRHAISSARSNLPVASEVHVHKKSCARSSKVRSSPICLLLPALILPTPSIPGRNAMSFPPTCLNAEKLRPSSAVATEVTLVQEKGNVFDDFRQEQTVPHVPPQRTGCLVRRPEYHRYALSGAISRQHLALSRSLALRASG